MSDQLQNKLPSTVDLWTSKDVEFIVNGVRHVIPDATGIYVVGSSAFGIEDSRDIDIIVTHPTFIAPYSTNDDIVIESMRENKGKLRNQFTGHRIDWYLFNQLTDEYMVTDLGFVLPYFDVLHNELRHRIRNIPFPFNAQYDRDYKYWKVMLRNKTSRVREILF